MERKNQRQRQRYSSELDDFLKYLHKSLERYFYRPPYYLLYAFKIHVGLLFLLSLAHTFCTCGRHIVGHLPPFSWSPRSAGPNRTYPHYAGLDPV